ncbi:MAG: nitroreductase family protein [Micromonosporaceae bacterium]
MPVPKAEPLLVLDALHSTPARRYLSAEPVPDDVVWAILDAAVRGPSGGNQQAWGWVIVTDLAIKQQVAEWYREGWSRAYGDRRERILAAPPGPAGLSRRSFLAAEHLAQHIEEAPVWIFAVLRNAAGASNPRLGASIYGAVQQLILAARAFGVGTTLTTLYAGHEDEVRELLGLPDDALTMGLLPLGYPAKGRWAQPKRRPLDEVVHWNRWGITRHRN